jgi:hypothetical protein
MKLKFKKIILFLIVYTSYYSSYSQDYNITYFVTGYVSDYMGRRVETGNENEFLIDNYHMSRMEYLYRLDTLIKRYNFNIEEKINYTVTVSQYGNDKFYNFKSKSLSEKVNEFYRLKIDKLNSNDTIKRYDGPLIVRKVKYSNKLKMKSYFAGAFYIIGGVDKKGYYFKFSNSYGRNKAIKYILKKFNCKINEQYNNQIEGLAVAPFVETIYFIPTDEIKTIIDYELNLKNEIIKTHANKAYSK